VAGIGYDIWSGRDLKDDVKTIKDDVKAQASRTDAQASVQGIRFETLFTALPEERKLNAEAFKKADEKYFRLLEEVKDVKRKTWW
jgi:hypothetical protein